MASSATQNDMTARLSEFKKKIKDTGRDAIEGLEKAAKDLKMKELGQQFELVNKEFQSDTFKLIVVGRQKNGKSTFLNVILGQTGNHEPTPGADGGPMPTGELPTTATLTRVYHSPRPYVKAWTFDGKPLDWTFQTYHSDAVLRGSERANKEFFDNIREFEVGYPAPLCKYATLIDSPGTDESPKRTAITTEAVRSCDAAIVVYRHSPPPGESEMTWVTQNILGTGVRVFSVVNLWNHRVVDTRLRETIWDRLIRNLLGGEEYNGQDFTSQDIYFIDALRAGEAKAGGDDRAYVESGMALFERRLSDFLLREREETHVTRFVRAAEKHAEKVAEQISQRRSGLMADRKKLEEAAEAIRPRIAATRARRDKLPKILERHRRDCIRDLTIGFEQMIGQLRQELPSLVKGEPIKALQGIMGTIKAHFTQKAAASEAADTVMAIVKQRIENWCTNPPSKPGAQQILEPVVHRMIDEVVDEVAAIQTGFQDLHFELTGWSPAVPKDPKKDITGRIIGIVGGILLGDVGLIVGGAGGLRGFAGTLGGYLVGGILAGIMGLSFPVALPLMLITAAIAAITSTRVGLENRIWDLICRTADEELRKVPAEVKTKIEAEAMKTFSTLETAVMKDVDSIINQEEENIRQILTYNQQDQIQKDQALQLLDRTESQLNERLQQLRNVVVLAKQVGGQERASTQAA